MKNNKLQVINDGQYFITQGCTSLFGFEFSVNSLNIEEHNVEELINYIYSLYKNKSFVVLDNQTMAYYSWLISFKKTDSNHFEVFELNPLTKELVQGIYFSTNLLNRQKIICEQFGVECDFPHFGEMIAVSIGYENSKLSCERHERELKDCGWYITSDLYNGDYKTINLIHFSHFAVSHYNILDYIALPEGFSLDVNNGEVIVNKFY